MTQARANEILRTKYAEGEIAMKGKVGGVGNNRYAVTFKPNGKVYSYGGSSYAEVLIRLGFNVLYTHTAENFRAEIAELEAKIEAGGWENIFFDDMPDFVEYTEEEIESMNKQIAWLKETLATAIIED